MLVKKADGILLFDGELKQSAGSGKRSTESRALIEDWPSYKERNAAGTTTKRTRKAQTKTTR
ncbi:hypothetical protein RLO149_c020720 [Roseobacter litoralis Och 149]|uniref:Uncharacterized protein n=1 Tax=Roseobacter litoralis (strain ATCC 49566 / DSM 6996 / JCM 21268 / NBRC 15278 / OCh 149) TaxID=391595 RepID=F7ZLJ7_ROSLO|nr:hypothetical protein RLO149_c020720 [Roseobacter litoralis Och 149]